MSLRDMSADDLRAASVDLDHQIRSLRERRVAIAKELERRIPEPEPESRVLGEQVVSPGFVEAESEVPSLDEPKRRKRRWR